ncbi:MAG: tetratricopeptide repeat protein [Acidobacteriota bacterium]
MNETQHASIRPSLIPNQALIGLALVLVSLLPPGRLTAQDSAELVEERRITAIDVVVRFEASGVREWAKDGAVPKRLTPEDFEVRFDGEPRTVVAVEPTAGHWQTVVYFDAALMNGADLRWAARTLADKGAELAELGSVQIIVADPEPRTVLSSTSDPEEIHTALSQLAQTLEGSNELVALRSEVLAELQREPPELSVDDLVAVAQGESVRVAERLDELLLTLVEYETTQPHRLLLLASGGFDIYPGAFYKPLIAQMEAQAPEGVDGPSAVGSSAAGSSAVKQLSVRDAPLPAVTDGLAQTLASYGWITAVVAPPPPKMLKPGLRIGKFRLSGPGMVYDEEENRTFFKFFSATFEENRKPERAEAYLELGAALEGQGKLEDAEDALRKAIYYFSGDPRTAKQQAATYVYLGKVLEAQNKSPQAIEAFERASRLDPAFTYEEVGATAELLDGTIPLGAIAEVTAGQTVRSRGQLSDLFEDLGQRVRLTYQVAGLPDGKIHPLQARYLGPPRQLSHPGWARHALPESVAAARARRLLAGEPSGGSWRLQAAASPTSTYGRAALALSLEEATAQLSSDEPAVVRLTLATGGPDEPARIEHRQLGLHTAADLAAWRQRLELDVSDATWVAVIVEDLAGGGWGGRLIELP